MWPFLGSLISAGSSLIGGLFGQSNQAAMNQQNVQAQAAINQQNIQAQEAINAENIAEQEKFAQSGVQWKVADAKAAGINPLAALGANTASFSNVVAPQVQAPSSAVGSNAFGTGLAGAGQDIGRAIAAMQSPEDKIVAVQKTALDLESLQLDNDLKRAQLASSVAKATQAGQPPGLPPVVGDRRPGMQSLPGADTDYSIVKAPDGSLVSMPSAEFQRGAFGNTQQMFEWFMRNRVPQTFGFSVPPELAGPDKDMAWFQNPVNGKWYQSRSWSSTFDPERIWPGQKWPTW